MRVDHKVLILILTFKLEESGSLAVAEVERTISFAQLAFSRLWNNAVLNLGSRTLATAYSFLVSIPYIVTK